MCLFYFFVEEEFSDFSDIDVQLVKYSERFWCLIFSGRKWDVNDIIFFDLEFDDIFLLKILDVVNLM